MKKLRRGLLCLSLIQNNKGILQFRSLYWKKLSFKLHLLSKRRKNSLQFKSRTWSKSKQKLKYSKNLSKQRSRKSSWILTQWKLLLTFLKTFARKFQKQTSSFHFRLTYQMTNSPTFCTKCFQSSHLKILQHNTWSFVTNVSTWNKLSSKLKTVHLYRYLNGLLKDLKKS